MLSVKIATWEECVNGKIFGIGQSISAITKAVSDGDMTPEDAGTLSDLLEQSVVKLTPANLEQAVTELAAACVVFE